jgi:hypothetical protein
MKATRQKLIEDLKFATDALVNCKSEVFALGYAEWIESVGKQLVELIKDEGAAK